MLRTLLIYLFLITLPCARAEGAPAGEFHLRDGARLRGTLETVEPQHLRVRPPWSRDSVSLAVEDLEMFIPRPRSGPVPLSPPHQVVFHSGDELGGRLVSIRGTNVRLESAWGEMFDLDSRQIQEIRMRPPTAEVLVDHAGRVPFEGGNPWQRHIAPPRMEAIGSEIFRYDERPGQFGFQLPPASGSFELDFRFRQEKESVRYEVAFFMPQALHRQGPGSVVFAHMNEHLRINHGPQGNVFVNMGQNNWQGTRASAASRIQRIRLVYDHSRRTMALWHNGHLVHTWPYAVGAEAVPLDRATWMSLRVHGADQEAVVVDRLEMLGFPGGSPAELREPAEGAAFALSLRNADSLDGGGLSLEAGRFSLTPLKGVPVELSLELSTGLRFDGRARSVPVPLAEVRMGASRSRLGLSGFQLREEGVLAESSHWRGSKLLPWPQIDVITFSE